MHNRFALKEYYNLH